MKYEIGDIVRIKDSDEISKGTVVGWYEIPGDINATFVDSKSNGIYFGDYKIKDGCCFVYTKNSEQIYRKYIFFYEQIESICQYTPEDNS